MAKITLTHDDRDYTLAYTRETARTMQQNGFDIAEIRSKPNIMIPLLFRGAFLAYHKDIKTKVVDDIFDKIKDRSGLIGELIGMYQECVDSLFDEPEEGNVSWKKS